MKKPIAKVLMLDGPTHFLTLPVAGPVAFQARTSVPIHAAEDLVFVKAAIPAGQMRIRELQPHQGQQPQETEPQAAPKAASRGKRRAS